MIPHAALQTIVPVPGSVQTTFTARVGETAILPCPIQPGALSQYYSVIWMKDGVEIIRANNPQIILPQNGNSRLDLDGAYSLIIHSVNLNDSSSDYQCMLFVTNPDTHTKQEVQPDREVAITLNVIIGPGMHIYFQVKLDPPPNNQATGPDQAAMLQHAPKCNDAQD